MLYNRKFQMKNPWRWLVLLLVFFVPGFFNKCDTGKSKVYRIGILSGLDRHNKAIDGFKARMTELSYIEGENIKYDVHKAEGDPAAQTRIAKQFISDKVDLIFAFPTEAAMKAKAVTKGTSIPLIFGNAAIEGTGLVESLRQPGGNTTGIRYPGPDLQVKRFELLLELIPHIKRLYITYDPDYPTIAPALKLVRPAASSRGVTLVEAPVKSMQALQSNLKAMEKAADIGIDAIMLLPEVFSQTPAAWDLISKFGEKHKLPIAGVLPSTADTGAVFSFSPNVLGWGQQAAQMANKILKGTPAGQIPVVSPEMEFNINYIRAQKLGLNVPVGMLKMANKVIR